MYISLVIDLSIYQSFFLFLYVYLSIYISIYLPIYLTIDTSLYLSIYIYCSIYLSIYRSIYLPIYLYIYISTFRSIYPSNYLSIFRRVSAPFDDSILEREANIRESKELHLGPLSVQLYEQKITWTRPKFLVSSVISNQTKLLYRPLHLPPNVLQFMLKK